MVYVELALKIEAAIATGETLLGVSFDYSKCFDLTPWAEHPHPRTSPDYVHPASAAVENRTEGGGPGVERGESDLTGMWNISSTPKLLSGRFASSSRRRS